MLNQLENSVVSSGTADATAPREPLETTGIVIEAFQKGDIAQVLEHVAEDVDWEYDSAVDVPWYRARKGKDGAKAFFESLAAVEFLRFDPSTYLGKDDVVVVIIQGDYRLRSNGRRVVYEDGVLLFRYDAEGRIAEFAHRVDLHKAWSAYHER